MVRSKSFTRVKKTSSKYFNLTTLTTRKTTANTDLAKVAIQCYTDTFVDYQSFVLRINICSENRHLHQAQKRYQSLHV